MTTLFRPTGLDELSLIWESGMREFPTRLPHQPIFYPVTNIEYATQIARDWNTKDGSLAGYVTEFEVDDPYIAAFEPHIVGSSLHKEYWIPAERLSDFNTALQGTIRLHSAYFGPEHVQRILRMYEGCQRLAVLVDLNAHRRNVFEQFERPLVIHKLHAFVPLHPLLAREPLIFRNIDPRCRPNELLDAEAQASANRASLGFVVGLLAWRRIVSDVWPGAKPDPESPAQSRWGRSAASDKTRTLLRLP